MLKMTHDTVVSMLSVAVQPGSVYKKEASAMMNLGPVRVTVGAEVSSMMTVLE